MSKYIQNIDQLKHYLYIAMQLEHATIPPYLVAMYSIKPGSNPDAVNVIRAVVVEEMLHLTLACNILNAVGGSPDLSKPGFVAQYPTPLPDGETDFVVDRAAFSKESLETFLQIERPAYLKNQSLKSSQSNARETTLISNRDDRPEMDFYSIGEFYNAIADGLKFLHDQDSSALFTGDRNRQISSDYYYSSGGGVIEVYDLDSALAAIDEIVEQGEGATNAIDNPDDEVAHYFRFEQLKLGRYYIPGDEPGKPSGKPLHVDWSAVFPIKTNVVESDYPQGSAVLDASREFNSFYSNFLERLTEAFNGKPENLIPAVMDMFHIKELIHNLVRNPMPGYEGVNAAPTFEVNLVNKVSKYVHSTETVKAHTVSGDESFNALMDLSVKLTGCSMFQLYSTNQSEAYYKVITDIVGQDLLDEITHIFKSGQKDGSKSNQDEVIRYQLMSHDKYGPVARNIIKLWYIGYWYQLPSDWRCKYGTNEKDVTFVVSAESYTEGLLWPVVGANPSGAKPFGYGSWALAPKFME